MENHADILLTVISFLPQIFLVHIVPFCGISDVLFSSYTQLLIFFKKKYVCYQPLPIFNTFTEYV